MNNLLLEEISEKFGFGTVSEETSPNYHLKHWSVNVQNDGVGGCTFAVVSSSSTNSAYYHVESKAIVLRPISNETVGANRLPPLPINSDEGPAFFSLHPFIEGAVVYRWKFGGRVLFSTRRRSNARFTRYGKSRFLPECMRSLGSPTDSQLFPPSTTNEYGEGIAYVFLVAHKSFALVSNVDLGDGRVFFLGAMEAASGKFVPDTDPRVKWAGISTEVVDYSNPPLLSPPPPSYVEVTTEDIEETNVGETEEEMDFNAASAAEAAAIKALRDYEVEIHHSTMESEISAAESGIATPFPPRSVASPFGPIGESTNSVRRALEDAGGGVGGEEEPPAVCYPPTFHSVEEANEFLHVGPYTQNRVISMTNPPFYDSLARVYSDGLLSTGEPVILRKVFPDGTTTFTKFQPTSYTWKMAVGGFFNTDLRVARLRTLAYRCNKSPTGGTGSGSGWGGGGLHFDWTPFINATAVVGSEFSSSPNHYRLPASNDLEYPQLFPPPPSFVFSKNGFNGREIIQEMKAISDEEGRPLVAMPESIYNRCLYDANATSSLPNDDGEISNRLYWWACVTLMTCVSPYKQSEVATAALEFAKVCESVSENLLKIAKNSVVFSRILNSRTTPYTDYVFLKWRVEKTGRLIPAASYATKMLFNAIKDVEADSLYESVKRVVDSFPGEEVYSVEKAFRRFQPCLPSVIVRSV